MTLVEPGVGLPNCTRETVAEPAKHRGGRPPKVAPKKGQAVILHGLRAGKLLTHICREQGIDPWTVYDWCRKDSKFEHAFNDARVMLAHVMAEGCIAYADEASGLDAAGVAARRLQVDTRKWFVAKICPRLYGDAAKLEVEHTQSEPLRVLVEHVTVDRSASRPRIVVEALPALPARATARITDGNNNGA